MNRISLIINVKSQGIKKFQVFSQGTDDSKTLTRKILYIADHEHVNISSFAVLDIKLWPEENGDLNTDQPLYSFKFIKWMAQN